MRFAFTLSLFAVLCACKTKVATDRNFDPFPTTANLSFTAFSSLYAEGVDLYAYNNEAGWKLRIDLGNRAIFTGSDGAERVFHVQPGANAMVNIDEPFVFNDGVNNMHVQFQRIPCEDVVHKYTSPYTAEVTLNEVSYRGCGLNVFDKRINGTWKLHEIASIPVDKQVMQNTVLMIQADSGMTGAIVFCDSVGYQATFRGSSVQMGTSKRTVLPRCKARAGNDLPGKFATFMEYTMENDSLLVMKDAEEKRYGFLRK